MERRMQLIKDKAAQRSKSESEEAPLDPSLYNPEDILFEASEEPGGAPESTEQSIEDLFQMVKKDLES